MTPNSNTKSNLKRFGILFLVFQITLVSFISEFALNVTAADSTTEPSIELSASKTDWTNEDVTITSKIKGAYVPAESKEVTAQTSANYNVDGFAGTLSEYLHSGIYTPAETKEVLAQTSPNYNDGVFSGTLSQYVYSGNYVAPQSRTETSQLVSPTNSFVATQAYNSR